jgi:cell wall-associated NlpC family hydrolase
MKYNGHAYHFGGPSNPTNGWDCSSFASYVLGHDLNMTLPGNETWAKATGNGQSHGPVASEFANTPGFTKVSGTPTNNQPGDLLVWTGHVGFGTGGGGMFSAFDTASGTLSTKASAPYSYLGTFRAH